MEGSAVVPRPAQASWIHADTVRELFRIFQVDVDKPHANGATPLHCAASMGNNSMVAALLAAGSAVDPRDPNGLTPLHAAASWGHVEVTHLLLSHGANIDSQTAGGLTPLHYAARNNRSAAVRLLLKAGADANDGERLGITPLHCAARSNEAVTTQLLLQANGDPNLGDSRGRTALHYALDENSGGRTAAKYDKRCETLRCLIEAGADVNRVDYQRFSPLLHALYYDRRSCLWVLLRAGATLDMDKINDDLGRCRGSPNDPDKSVDHMGSSFRYIEKVIAAGGYENLVRTYRQVLTAPRRGCLTRYLRQRFGRDAPHDVTVHVLEFWKLPGGP